MMDWDEDFDFEAMADEIMWREDEMKFAALEAAGPPPVEVEVFDPACVLDGPFEALEACAVCAVGGADDCGVEDDYDPPCDFDLWVDEDRMADRFEHAMGW